MIFYIFEFPVFSKLIFFKSFIEKCLVLLSEYIFKPSYSKVNIFTFLLTEDGVVTSKLSGSYIPCFSVYVKSLSEITQYSEVLL